VIALAASLALANAAGCQSHREPETPPQPCQPGTCPPGQWPTLGVPTADASPTAAPPGLMPAFVGFPCHADEDLICGWGKCIAGRCGGCQTHNECKNGGACGWTPIGMACVYGGSSVPH
jgi:hypothetical protein